MAIRLVLSNHVEQRLFALQSEREALDAADDEAWRHACREQDVELKLLRQEKRDALREGLFFTALRLWFRVRKVERRPYPAAPVRRVPTDDERRLEAGVQGESEVADHLGRLLPGDGWTVVLGYKNRHGECDCLLVGPPFILALEVKHYSGFITCDGDVWRRTPPLSGQGRPRPSELMMDRTGRSPSELLRACVESLEGRFAQKGITVRIERGVVVTHMGAQFGSMRNPTVRVGKLNDLREWLWELTRQSSLALPIKRVIEIIEADHAYWAGAAERARCVTRSRQAREDQEGGGVRC